MARKDLTEEHVRDAAYRIWLDEGQPHGRDEAHWQHAIETLNAPKDKAERKPAAKKPALQKPAAKKAASKAKAAPKKTAK